MSTDRNPSPTSGPAARIAVRRGFSRQRAFLWLLLFLVGLSGCRALDFYDRTLEQPAPPGLVPPYEMAMRS
ncbi:MAG: hypothetical protein JW719_05475, partial [Pirellulales bacterium]|nr:hypothetical protein [Pirellulales bacterium]